MSRQNANTPTTGPIRVKIGRIPGTIIEVELDGDYTIEAALIEAGISMEESQEARVGGGTLSYEQVHTPGSHALDAGDVVHIVAKTKGNEPPSVTLKEILYALKEDEPRPPRNNLKYLV